MACLVPRTATAGEIAALVFGLSPAGGTRLFSVGADRRLAEYDLAASGPGAGLVLGQLQELMPEACKDVPTAGELRGWSTCECGCDLGCRCMALLQRLRAVPCLAHVDHILKVVEVVHQLATAWPSWSKAHGSGPCSKERRFESCSCQSNNTR
jgi:hypothetical protein